MAKDSSATKKKGRVIPKEERQVWASRPRRAKDDDRKDRISFRVHVDLRDVLEAAATSDMRTISAYVELLLIQTLRDTYGAPLDNKGRLTKPGWAMPPSGSPLTGAPAPSKQKSVSR